MSTGRSASTLRRLIRDAEKELARLERQQATFEGAVAEAAAANDHAELARLGDALSDVQAQVRHAEEQWLELGTELETTDSLTRSRRR